MSKICTALVPLQSFSSFKSYSNFNFKIAQKWEILRENNVIFQFLENLNIYLPMSYLSFFQLFNDFFLKNGAKFDTFSLIFEIQPLLLIRFSDAEIPIVQYTVIFFPEKNCILLLANQASIYFWVKNIFSSSLSLCNR